MALPVFRSAGALAHSTTTITPPAPAGLTTDDIELMTGESQAGTHSLSTANGFVQLGNQIDVPSGTATVATHGSLWWRRWNGTDGDPTFAAATNHMLGRRAAFSGCILTGDPWDINIESSEAVEDTSGSATGGTTSVADCLIAILIGAAKPDSLGTAEVSAWANVDLAAVTERYDGAGNSGNGGHLGLATGEKASAGAFGATTYTKATAAYKWHYVIALKPPANGAPAGQPTMARHQGVPGVALPTPRLFFIPRPRVLRLPSTVYRLPSPVTHP